MGNLDHVEEFDFPAEQQYVREAGIMDCVYLFEKPIDATPKPPKDHFVI
jgi:hypothetical protein